LGGGKYKIIATLYRDCRGIAMIAAEFGVYGGKIRGKSCGDFKISNQFTRTAIKDVTPHCDTAKSGCKPQNSGGSAVGIEQHTYEATIDFSNTPFNTFGGSNCCDVTFYVTQCCRNGAITTGPAVQNYFSSCGINICNLSGAYNNSPEFSNMPIFFACCNQPYQ